MFDTLIQVTEEQFTKHAYIPLLHYEEIFKYINTAEYWIGGGCFTPYKKNIVSYLYPTEYEAFIGKTDVDVYIEGVVTQSEEMEIYNHGRFNVSKHTIQDIKYQIITTENVKSSIDEFDLIPCKLVIFVQRVDNEIIRTFYAHPDMIQDIAPTVPFSTKLRNLKYCMKGFYSTDILDQLDQHISLSNLRHLYKPISQDLLPLTRWLPYSRVLLKILSMYLVTDEHLIELTRVPDFLRLSEELYTYLIRRIPHKIPSLERYSDSFWQALIKENGNVVWMIPSQMVSLIHTAKQISKGIPENVLVIHCRDQLSLELSQHSYNVSPASTDDRTGIQDIFNQPSETTELLASTDIGFMFKTAPIGTRLAELRIKPDFCLGLVKIFKCLKHVDVADRTVEIVRAALEFDLDQIDEHVRTMEDPLIRIMVSIQKNDLSFLEHMSDDEMREICKKVPYLLRYIPQHIDTETIAAQAVKEKASNILYVQNVTPRIALEYLKHDPSQYTQLVLILCGSVDICCVCYEVCITRTTCNHLVCNNCKAQCQGKCPMCRAKLV